MTWGHINFVHHATYTSMHEQCLVVIHKSSLPNPDDPLSRVVPSQGILLANKEVARAHLRLLFN